MTVQHDRRIETLTGQTPIRPDIVWSPAVIFTPGKQDIVSPTHGFTWVYMGRFEAQSFNWNHPNFCERMMRWDLRNRDTPVDLVIILKVWIACSLPISTFSRILPGDSQVTCLRSSNPTANHWAKRFLMDELRAWSSCLASRSFSSFSPSLQEMYIKYLCVLLCTSKMPQSEYFNTLLCK